MGETSHIISRLIPLSMARSCPQEDKALPTIAGLHGVEEVTPTRLSVSYDVAVTSYKQVCHDLQEAGFDLKRSLATSLRRSWYEYLDGTLRANFGRQQKLGCCSNPTDVYIRRKNKR